MAAGTTELPPNELYRYWFRRSPLPTLRATQERKRYPLRRQSGAPSVRQKQVVLTFAGVTPVTKTRGE